MMNETEHWKVLSNYIISVLFILVVMLIAWVIKSNILGPESSPALGITGFIFIIAGILSNESSLKLKESAETISPEKINTWMFKSFLIMGIFFLFLWIL